MIKTFKSALTSRSAEGSTERLLQLCFGYFASYVATGMLVKYFTGSPKQGLPGMNEIAYLLYSTFGSSVVCLVVVIWLGWYRLKSDRRMKILGMDLPAEIAYIIPSGVCTAVVIPTTTLMYLLPISVMVAMTIMRASIIIISRIIDEIQIRQGILRKKVYWEENAAVVFALIAASTQLLWVKTGDFDFLGNFAAVAILSSYILAYGIRIYIMNYYKNTRPKGVPQDNNGFFAVEQFSAAITMALVTAALLFVVTAGADNGPIAIFQNAFFSPDPLWFWAMAGGSAYGIGAFFSVFLFMFKGRTATFAGLVNRLTSLVAGTGATLLTAFFLGGKYPKTADWIGLGFILIAVYFLGIAEKKRSAELCAAHELEPQACK